VSGPRPGRAPDLGGGKATPDALVEQLIALLADVAEGLRFP
jgi:hypothetical protein